MKLFSRIFIFGALLLSIFGSSFVVSAAPVTSGSNVPLVNPIGGNVKSAEGAKGIINVKELIGKGLTVVLGIMGSLTLCAFVFGGYMWLTSAGNDEKVRTGTSTLMYATIGLFIIFGAYAILNTILKGVAK